ncbi:MAG: FAD:protein FMN transferase [Planctomycetaceae bacterium]
MTLASMNIAAKFRIAVLLLIAANTGIAVAGTPQRFEFARIRMGVPFRVTVYADDEAVANSAVDAAFRRVKVLNDVFSDYDPRSESSRLCRDAVPGKPLPVSRDLQTVLERSQFFAELSHGAFDVTVGPMTKLWRRAKRSKQLPSHEQIEQARSLVGFHQLSLNSGNSTVTFDRTGIQLDFGGIACGYACDEIVRILKSHGLTRVLVESSGDIVAGDPPPGNDHWTIGIGSLAKPDAPPEKFIALVNRAVTTSGDAYQFVEFDGVRYSHIVDPKTGLGLTTRSSATVIAPDCTTADALATAACVLGPDKGRTLIESFEGAEMLMIYVDEDGEFRTATTPGFEESVVQMP